MRFLYSFLIMVSTPFVLLYFALRGLRDRAYLGHWNERFGFIPHPIQLRGIWVHAASVGEFNAACPLIKALLKTYPELPVMVSTLTPTGAQRVKKELGDQVSHSYIPIDLPGAVSRFLSRLQPRLVIVMETEIWPNLFLGINKLNIPLLMANARLSKRSTRRFSLISGLIKEALQSVTWVGAQSSTDEDRLLSCGVTPHRSVMTGNLKYDLLIPARLELEAATLRDGWNSERPVLVAGSTHEADENIVIPAFVELLTELPGALLILVPRYPERFSQSTQRALAAGLRTELRSQGESCSEQAQCFVIDSVGELMKYYACGDIAFVGGSMGDQGGHNALEPAALGKPVLLGPNMNNAKEIASQLLLCNAARRVTDQQGFRQTAKQLLTDTALRDSMGLAGRALVEKNKGALDLTLKAVRKLL